MQKLMPCPFCGKQPTIGYPRIGDDESHHGIYCCVSIEGLAETDDLPELIATWNTRSPKRESGLDPDDILDLLEDLKAELMEFDSIQVQQRKVGRNNALSQIKEKITAMAADNRRRGRDD